MNKATTTKALQGIRRFLELRGFEIVEGGWKSGKLHVDFIARTFSHYRNAQSVSLGPPSGDKAALAGSTGSARANHTNPFAGIT